MTPSETPIQQRDRMIADFMDMKCHVEIGPFGGEYLYVQDIITKEWRPPIWDKSFDWLMPVFEKINSLGGYTAVHIDACNVNVHISRDQEFIQIPYVYENLKDSLFKGVCIAVEYLMKNKPVS